MERIPDDRYQTKKRLCLQCRRMFTSRHVGNRVCAKCRIDSLKYGKYQKEPVPLVKGDNRSHDQYD